MDARDFFFQTESEPGATASGRLYTSTVVGPHGSACGQADTGAAAVSKAAESYRQAFLADGMVPSAG